MSRLRDLIRNDRGAAAMMFGLAAVPITLAAGGALDFTRAGLERSQLQAKADSAALGAALARSVTTAAQRGDIAKQYFRATDIVTPVVTGPTITVAVTASRDMNTTLLGIIGKKTLTITAKATAIRTTQGPPACAIALNKHASNAIEFGGNTSFTAPTCGMYSNSDSSTAITAGGSASVNAAGYCAVGGTNMPSNTKPEPITGCDVIEDPYASPNLVPASTTCTTNNFKSKPSDNITISPGVFCGGMDFKGTVKLNPGIYVVKNGPLTVNSGANISGDGVVFYMTGTDAGYKLNGGGTINLKASTQPGPYKGLLIVQDSASNVGAENTLNGDANMTLIGAIYTPTQKVTVTGNGGFGQGSPFMPIVADTLKFWGSSTVQINYNQAQMDTNGTLPHVEIGARLIN